MKLLDFILKAIRKHPYTDLKTAEKCVDAHNVDFIEMSSLANSGNAIAMYVMSQILEDGIGCDKNFEKSVELLKHAAGADYPPALNDLAKRYSTGTRGVEKNLSKSFSLYRRSAAQGNVVGQYNVGICLLNGFGVDQDDSFASNWFAHAAEQGDAASQCALASLHMAGKGVVQDIEKAVALYGKSASAGDPVAQFNLGCLFALGKGVEKNSENAFFWFGEAADAGNCDAQYNLGIMLASGQGVERDEQEALRWYLKAAAGGHLLSQFNACDILLESTMKQIGIENGIQAQGTI